MPIRLVLLLSLFVSSVVFAGAPVKVLSQHDFKDTESRYLEALKQAQIPILDTREFQEALPGGFSRKGKIIEFSNPYYGWHLGECHRGERKDKPLSARIWQDNNNHVWLEYTRPEPRINQFGVIECGNETDLVNRKLMEFAQIATE